MANPDIEISDELPDKLKTNLRVSRSTYGRKTTVTKDECDEWRRLRAEGLSFREIAETTTYARRTVNNHVRGACSH